MQLLIRFLFTSLSVLIRVAHFAYPSIIDVKRWMLGERRSVSQPIIRVSRVHIYEPDEMNIRVALKLF